MKLGLGIRKIAAMGLVVLASACATAEPGADLAATDRTPGFNQAMLDVNIALDRNLLRPAAQGYDAVTPTTIKHLLGNGFSHLELPGDFINHLLQGEIDPALAMLGRFRIRPSEAGDRFRSYARQERRRGGQLLRPAYCRTNHDPGCGGRHRRLRAEPDHLYWVR